jgi:hypothetical protein
MTALSMSNNTKLNLKTAAGQQQAAAAAAELAFELDATSKVTGASREKLMETLKADEKKTANILATNAMNDEQRAQYSAMKRTLAEFGAPMADLTTELATGGLRTKEGIAQMATLGDAGTKLQAAVQMQMKASSLAQKEAANRAMEEAKAAVNARMGSAQYKAMYDNGSAEFKAAIDKQVQGREGFQMQQKAIQEADGDALKARKNQMAEAKAMQSGQKVDADGKPIVGADGKAVADEGAKSAQMLNAVNRQATIQAGGMARAMETANAALGKSPAAINAFNTALGFVGKSKTMKEAEQGVYKAPGAVAGAAGVAGGPTEKPTSGTTGRKVEKVPAHGDGGIIKGPEVPAHGDGGIIKGPELAVIAEKGPEAVIPLDKLKEMMGNVSTTISGASGGDPESALSQIQSRLQDRLSKVADLQKLASERELSDKEKESLKHAEFGVKRAANNLADELARQTKIDEVVSVSKNKAVESKKDETTKISEVAKSSSSPANMLASMFSPTIINQKAAEAQKALTNSAPKTTDAAPKNTEEAKKKEAEDKAKAAEDAKNKEKAAATPGTVKASAGDATMKDLKDQLVTLNKNMLQLINHSEATADAAHKTAKSTAKATGAR